MIPNLPPLKRRRFLALALGGVVAGAARLAADAGALPPAISRRARALGADVVLTVYHENRAEAEAAIAAAFARIEQVERVMSLYRPESQVRVLNRTGLLRNPHPDLVAVLEAGREWSRRTGGAFDVTVQPLWELFRRCCRDESRLPTEAEIAEVRAKVGWRHLAIEPDQIVIEKAGCRVTLNGIAQGFAADAARATLEAHGIRHALIDTGEIGVLGAHPAKVGWDIAIKHPRVVERPLAWARLRGRCLATSGDYESWFSADFANNHLLDARTGRSPRDVASVSVVAETACVADALSTAAFVLGLEEGRRLVESVPGADALLVGKDGATAHTRGFPLGSEAAS